MLRGIECVVCDSMATLHLAQVLVNGAGEVVVATDRMRGKGKGTASPTTQTLIQTHGVGGENLEESCVRLSATKKLPF
jgi:hypothetical protein